MSSAEAKELSSSGDSNIVRCVESVAREARLALRLLRKSPAFTVTAVLTLALGIGANTAVFTLMKLIVMDALPVRQPGQLVILHDSGPKLAYLGTPLADETVQCGRESSGNRGAPGCDHVGFIARS